MGNRNAHIVDWQQRAKEFSVGDAVFPFMDTQDVAGRVVQVFEAIGMVDVEFPNGIKRYPVEELQKMNAEAAPAMPTPITQTPPGGLGGVSVSGGPPKKEAVRRLAKAWVKKSLYWASRDRKYRASREEVASGNFTCPKCKEAAMRNAIYKRSEGRSEKLLGCPHCLFLIKSCDIVGHPSNEEVA